MLRFENKTDWNFTVMLGFIKAPGDRAADRRSDNEWLSAQLVNPQSRVVIFIEGRPAINVSERDIAINWYLPDEAFEFAAKEHAVLLHVDDSDNAVFAVQLGPDCTEKIETDAVKLIDLRSLARQATLPVPDLGALAQARSILAWHEFHQFCANCGAQTTFADAGFARQCPSCKREHFPRVDPVVIMLVRHGDSFLMGRGRNFAENSYSALAGFLEPGETIEAATRRETFEETGIKLGKVEYMMSQPWPFPSTLMIGVVADALTTEISLDEQELEDARWFSTEEIRQMLTGNHPEELTLPSEMSIAFQMVKEITQHSG
jgi:NAD+ diphosphatase